MVAVLLLRVEKPWEVGGVDGVLIVPSLVIIGEVSPRVACRAIVRRRERFILGFWGRSNG